MLGELDAIRQFQRDALRMKPFVDALVAHAEAAYGLFHDSAQGWKQLATVIETEIEKLVATGKTREEVLDFGLVHGTDHPQKGGVPLHRSTIRERLAACAPGGSNEIALSNLTTISIYAFWEDRTRGEIAGALGIDKNAVQSDLFGDIAKMRNIILHAGGVMDQRARAMKVLKWFSLGDIVLIDRHKLHEIIELIRQFPSGLRTVGYDPMERL
jgi:hypothetical protein